MPEIIPWDEVPEGHRVWFKEPEAETWRNGRKAHNGVLVQAGSGYSEYERQRFIFAFAEQQPGEHALHDCDQWECDALCCAVCRAKIEAISDRAEAKLAALRAGLAGLEEEMRALGMGWLKWADRLAALREGRD